MSNIKLNSQQKAALRKDLAKLFDECLVDEMQDTNPLQFRILQQFSREGVRLFCVGDPAQSIYRFRGANFERVYLFNKLFQNNEILMLSKNYRSYQEILDLSNWLLNRSPLDYKNRLVAHRGHGGLIPQLIDFDSQFEESSWIADKIMERSESDMRLRDMMVLVRTAFDAKPIEAEFIQREIPYVRSFGELESEEEERRVLYVALTCAKNELFITRSTDYRSGFWVVNSPTECEEYFLADVPQNLVAHKIEGWSTSVSSGLTSLKDIY